MTRNKKGPGVHFYYVCPARRNPDFVQKCPRPCGFRADHVDRAVWEWIKSFLTDPGALTEGLRQEQAECEEVNRPFRERLAVTDDLLDNNRRQLERALDLYLSGDFDKDILTERKTRLENTIDALEQERASLAVQLEAHTLTDEQVTTITEFAQTVARGLEKADEDFGARRRLIEMLDVQATLTVEDGQKVAYVRCMMGKDVLSIVSTSS